MGMRHSKVKQKRFNESERDVFQKAEQNKLKKVTPRPLNVRVLIEYVNHIRLHGSYLRPSPSFKAYLQFSISP